MIQITLTSETELDGHEKDVLGRDRFGYSETMSPLALYDANHGTWALGERAAQERYALLTYQGIVVQAIEIESIDKIDVNKDHPQNARSVINGKVLTAGHHVYDQYFGKDAPIKGSRNPVRYIEDPIEISPCRCGCGGAVEGPANGRDRFLVGHDQTALHARVRQIGTVAQFLDWFDVVRGAGPRK